MIILELIAFTIALIGYSLNNEKTLNESYYCWIISNSLWIVITFIHGNYILSAMFLTYNVFLTYKLQSLINKNQNHGN